MIETFASRPELIGSAHHDLVDHRGQLPAKTARLTEKDHQAQM
jgi:hypothetical protein